MSELLTIITGFTILAVTGLATYVFEDIGYRRGYADALRDVAKEARKELEKMKEQEDKND